MRKYTITILLIFTAGFLCGQNQPATPASVLHNGIQAVLQTVIDSSVVPTGSMAVFPSVEGNLSEVKMQPVVEQWRQIWQQSGQTVFIAEQAGIYKITMEISNYQFRLRKEGRLRLFRKRPYVGTLELSCVVTVTSPDRQLIGTVPVFYTTNFKPSKNLYRWRDEETTEAYPITWAGSGENPGVATVLLSVTSGVIIYLFYAMRG